MSESAESVGRAFANAINEHDLDALAALMTGEHCFIDSLGNVVRGRDKMRAGWAGYFRMVPDYTIVVEEAFSVGSVAILLGVAQGTYAPGGSFNEGNRWETPVAIRASIQEDKVQEWRVYADNEPIRKLMAKFSV